MTIIYKVGFTGTSKGMSPEQKAAVKAYLLEIIAQHPNETVEFHHGLCIGADEQAAAIAKELGCLIVAHPGFSPRNPNGRLFRSDFTGNDEVRAEKPHIKRDREIVDETQEMIAGPLGKAEEVRSGTWTTVRYAVKKGKSVKYAYGPW